MHDNYTKYSVTQQEAIGKQTENISKVATARNSFIISPRENSVIADCKKAICLTVLPTVLIMCLIIRYAMIAIILF